MWLVMACWVLAMMAGLLWARPYVSLCTLVTLFACVVTQPSLLTTWLGWIQMGTFGLTPWLLASQRARGERLLKHAHTEEALQMTGLSDSARSLLSLQSAMQQMETQITEITDLYHVTKETARAMHVNELFTASLTMAPRFLTACGIRLIDLSGSSPQVFRAHRAADGRMVPSPEAGPPQLLPMEQAIVTFVTSSGRASSGTPQTLACPFPEGITRVMWAPLWRSQQPVGVVVADELAEPQVKALSIVANQLSLQLARTALYQQVEALAVTDSLTGVFVRAHFMTRAREELARSLRHGLSCTLVMADLDHFKHKNDTFGHLVGDVVLKDVARLLARHLRDIDLMARFGGEEFIFLLIETDVEHAMSIAQRLRQLVEVHPIRAYDELLTQTISMGLAEFPGHAKTLEALIECADQALYAAKRAGRNRVVQWSDTLAAS